MYLVTFFSSLQGDTGSPGPPGLPGTVSKIVLGAVTIFKASLHFLHMNSSATIFKFLTSLQKLWDLFTLRLSPFVSEKQYQLYLVFFWWGCTFLCLFAKPDQGYINLLLSKWRCKVTLGSLSIITMKFTGDKSAPTECKYTNLWIFSKKTWVSSLE